MHNQFCPNIIKDGDLLAWRNDGSMLGNLVSYVTKGVYTHVGIAWSIHNRAYVIDAFWKGGVRLRYLGDNLPVDIIHTNVKWTEEIGDFAFSKMGRSYNYVGAAMLGLDITPNYDSEVCSLYAASILKMGGVLPKGKGCLTPQKLVDKVSLITGMDPVTINKLEGLQYE